MPAESIAQERQRRNGGDIISYVLALTESWPEIPGVIIADGAGVNITVKSGHLIVNDGIAGARRVRKYSRLTRDIHRLIILSASGYITLEAIHWLKEAGISWCQVSQSSGIQAISGPIASTDARLIRSQAYAPAGSAGLEIARYILGVKLRGHAENLASHLNAPDRATYVTARATVIESADSIALALIYEGLAAETYWAAWKGNVMVPFGASDLAKIPRHWNVYSERVSQADRTERNRFATDPINAMLNYLYRIAETECIHACHTIGLSPELGIIHSDKPSRASMALDLLETVRPVCDRIVLEILGTGERIDRHLFTEIKDGIVRMSPTLTHKLAAHSTEIASVLAPHVYHIAQVIARHGDGIIPVTMAKPLRGMASAKGRSTERLRKGVTVIDVIPDDCWQQIRDILPSRDPRVRQSACPERDLCAALAIKHILMCPWSATVINPAHRKAAARRLISWQQTGTWQQIKEILENSGHLENLLSS